MVAMPWGLQLLAGSARVRRVSKGQRRSEEFVILYFPECAGGPLTDRRRFFVLPLSTRWTRRVRKYGAGISAACMAAVLAYLCGISGCVVTPNYAAIEPSSIAGQQTTDLNRDLAVMAGQAAADSGDYIIGPEDLLEVTLYDIEDVSGDPRVLSVRVSNSGFITLPYVGTVEARGFSPTELERRLRVPYQRFIHNPQITIFVREYRSYRVSVVGYVERPGVLELRGRKTLLEAISLAGGLNQEAGRSVRLTRNNEQGVQSVLIDLDTLAAKGDLSLNLTLLPGDVISVPRAGIFYVEGTVNKPGAYPLLAATTVSQAIATAGGVDVAVANEPGTTLFRKLDNGQRQPIKIDMDAIREGKAQDFLVQADDVIVVPVSGPLFFVDRLTGLLRVGVNSRF